MSPGSREELEWRLSLIDPAESIRGVVFNSVLEVVRQLGDEHAVERCLEVAHEGRFMDYFNYPFRSLIEMTYTAAELLAKKYGSVEKALWQMGYQSAMSFYSSTAGRAVLLLSRGGPARLLDTMPSAFHTTWKSAEVSTHLTGPRSAVLTYKRDFMPRAYTEGGMQGTFEAAKVKGFKITAHPIGPLDTEYHMTWD
jgi:uncharacterized protein (TIGR02265 family)